MNRRQFCSLLATSSTGLLAPRLLWASDIPKDLRITRIIAFDLVSQRSKVAGKNSGLDVHGDRATDPMVRLQTNAGIEGLGRCRTDEKILRALLGKSISDLFKPAERSIQSSLGASTMPLWDLVGKALNKPVFALLGGTRPKSVPVYDGSIYFADLLPEYAGRWQDRFKQEIDMGLKRGHRTFKIKIGRGAKWMPTEEGYERDKAVIKIIRQHAGLGIALGVDANNGYDLARTKRLLADLPDIRLAWLEEMFPERIDQCLELKAFLAERKLGPLIADGETQNKLEPLQPFMEARAIDVFQVDMNLFGIEGILKEAAMAQAFGLRVAPHNWGSLIGFYPMLHLAQAISNFYYAENDPLTTDVLIADGYNVKNGRCSVPDAPGFGLKINEEKFSAQIKPKLDLNA